jgi:altronate dehydratase
MPLDPRLLRLHAADNVLTVIRTLEAGDDLAMDESRVPVPARLPIGHKVAARVIAADERIIKYGAPIGSAKRDIAVGEHVHTHNIRSDYIPTFARGEGAHYEHTA